LVRRGDKKSLSALQRRGNEVEFYLPHDLEGPKRDKVIGEWRKLHNGELHNLYSSPDIVRQIKSRRMRWVGHLARMGEGRGVYRVLVGSPKGKNHLKDQGIDGRMGSKCTLGRLVGGCGMDSPGSG
jgi:hypothetical protein